MDTFPPPPSLSPLSKASCLSSLPPPSPLPPLCTALFGGGVLRVLRAAARRGLVAQDADIVPARASLFCMGLQVRVFVGGWVGVNEKERANVHQRWY